MRGLVLTLDAIVAAADAIAAGGRPWRSVKRVDGYPLGAAPLLAALCPGVESLSAAVPRADPSVDAAALAPLAELRALTRLRLYIPGGGDGGGGGDGDGGGGACLRFGGGAWAALGALAGLEALRVDAVVPGAAEADALAGLTLLTELRLIPRRGQAMELLAQILPPAPAAADEDAAEAAAAGGEAAGEERAAAAARGLPHLTELRLEGGWANDFTELLQAAGAAGAPPLGGPLLRLALPGAALRDNALEALAACLPHLEALEAGDIVAANECAAVLPQLRHLACSFGEQHTLRLRRLAPELASLRVGACPNVGLLDDSVGPVCARIAFQLPYTAYRGPYFEVGATCLAFAAPPPSYIEDVSGPSPAAAFCDFTEDMQLWERFTGHGPELRRAGGDALPLLVGIAAARYPEEVQVLRLAVGPRPRAHRFHERLVAAALCFRELVELEITCPAPEDVDSLGAALACDARLEQVEAGRPACLRRVTIARAPRMTAACAAAVEARGAARGAPLEVRLLRGGGGGEDDPWCDGEA
ncbi:MAG: hypothetical protein J3K34DRAFT_389882 [Monoraphidium minutum]|nr:MAG: hypothetical protein J3K34DRAFT_389882 [Monoraphidium minutum]